MDYNYCAWSHKDGKPASLRLLMPEFFFQSINAFHIAGTLQSFDQNESSNGEWYADIQVDNV